MNRLFVLAFDNTENGDRKVERDSHRKYFLPTVDITNYNVLIDGRNFYDQPINDQIKKLFKKLFVRYQYFKDHYQLIAVDLSKQKELDPNPIASQQTEFLES